MGSPEPNVCALGRLVGLGPLDVEKDRVAAPVYRSPPVVCTRLSNALTEGTVNSPSRRKPWKTTQRAAASIRRSGLSMLVSLRKAARIRLRMCLVIGSRSLAGRVCALAAPRFANGSNGLWWQGSGRPCSRCHDETAARYTPMVRGARLRRLKSGIVRLLAGRGQSCTEEQKRRNWRTPVL